MFDERGIAGGGSGAAGAFLSPKFSKKGALKELINQALLEAFRFYESVDASAIQKTPLLHIAKDSKDAKHLQYCKKHDDLELLSNPPFIPDDEYIYTSKSAIVDAKRMCCSLAYGCKIFHEEIQKLEKEDRFWLLNKRYKAKIVVVATGGYRHALYYKPYSDIRSIWGHRIDVRSSLKLPCSVHQFVSISPTRDGILSIGATHDVHFYPNAKEYDFCAGRSELLQKANKTVALGSVEVVKDYVGLRGGTIDYLPFLGKVVDVAKTLKKVEHHDIYTKHFDYTKFFYHDNLYVINGSAGYGFVLAPLLARLLVAHIVEQKSLPYELEAARFFARWAKKEEMV